jgi:enoyl-CoA hydratase/carnithine racemase
MNDLAVDRSGPVALLEMRRPPHNYFDEAMVDAIATALEACDQDNAVRAVVLCSQGKNFCAGASFNADKAGGGSQDGAAIYRHAVRIFRCAKPLIAVVQGSAVGGGLGLALAADFRVVSSATRMAANFTRLGLHPGFGTTVTLPRLVGPQQAAAMFFTGRRLTGVEAQRIGLADILADADKEREAALEFATEISQSAPLAVVATRKNLRLGLADQVAAAVERELFEQLQLMATHDFREGVRAVAERRPAQFEGR